jgi:plasmid maintenance system antidote protein VapI
MFKYEAMISELKTHVEMYMDNHGLSCYALSKKSGIADNVIRSVLKGKPCTLNTADKIARATGAKI